MNFLRVRIRGIHQPHKLIQSGATPLPATKPCRLTHCSESCLSRADRRRFQAFTLAADPYFQARNNPPRYAGPIRVGLSLRAASWPISSRAYLLGASGCGVIARGGV